MNHDDIEQKLIVDRYLMDKLAHDEKEEFERHYLHCVSCQNELSLAAKLQRGLRAEYGPSEVAEQEPVMPSRWQRFGKVLTHPAYGIAATLLVATALTTNLISLRLFSGALEDQALLQQQLELSQAPQSNTQIILLSALRSGRGANDGAAAHRIPLDDHSTWVVLALSLPPNAGFPPYRVALRDSSATTLWRADDLEYNSNEEIVLTVHSSMLSGGDYSLQVESLKADDSWDPVGQYAFRIQAPDRRQP